MISPTAYVRNLGYLRILGKGLNEHRRILGSQFLVTDPQLSILITTHAVDEVVRGDQSSMLKSTRDLPDENAIGAVFGSWLEERRGLTLWIRILDFGTHGRQKTQSELPFLIASPAVEV